MTNGWAWHPRRAFSSDVVPNGNMFAPCSGCSDGVCFAPRRNRGTDEPPGRRTPRSRPSIGGEQATSGGLMVRVGIVDRWLAERVQRLVAPVAVRLELWDGTSPFSASRPPVGDLVVRDRRTLLGLAVNPTCGLARPTPPAGSRSEAQPSRSSRRCRVCRAPWRRGAPASWRCWPRPIPSAMPAAMSTTTIWATTSISYGSIPSWSTPARTSLTRRCRSPRRSVPSSIWCAANCGCAQATPSSRPGAAGERWPFTWRATTA